MNKYGNTSEKGKKAIQQRWANYEKKFSDKLKESDKIPDYKLLFVRLCGFLMGDGSVFTNKNNNGNSVNYNICFYPDDSKVLNLYLKTFCQLFGISPHVHKYEKYYQVRIRSKLIYHKLLLSSASFGALKWNMPDNLLSDKILKKEWLRAYFDCEGYVGKKVIHIQSVNKNGLERIHEMLKEFNIESRIYSYQRKNKNWNTNYLLYIMRKESRLNYLKEIGFNHPIKQAKLISFMPESHNGSAPEK